MHTWGYLYAIDHSCGLGVATWLQLTVLAGYSNLIRVAHNILIPGFSKENI